MKLGSVILEMYVFLLITLGVTWAVPAWRNRLYIQRKIKSLDCFFIFGSIAFELIFKTYRFLNLPPADIVVWSYDVLFVGVLNVLVYKDLLPEKRIWVFGVLLVFFVLVYYLGSHLIYWNYIVLILGFTFLLIQKLLNDGRPTWSSFSLLSYSVLYIIIFITTIFDSIEFNWSESKLMDYFGINGASILLLNVIILYVKSRRPVHIR